MSAKSELFTRLQYISAATNLPTLIDDGIAITEHNGVANLLRKGLGIVAFNILEDFIKNKCMESLEVLSTSTLPFNYLTEQLQESAISGALKAIVYRGSLLKKNGLDWKAFIQEESGKIHSTRNFPYQLSQVSLVSDQPNISGKEISEVLKSFGIVGGWQTMKSVSDSIGGGLPDLSQAYNNAESRRHSSAHAAAFQYDYAWISTLKNEILAIAASFDILLTARCRQVITHPLIQLDTHNISVALNYRFLEPNGSFFRETTVIGGRARKNWNQFQAAMNYIQPRLSGRNEFLIILNPSRRIEDWAV